MKRHGLERDVRLHYAVLHPALTDQGPGGHGPLNGDIPPVIGQHEPDVLEQRRFIGLDAPGAEVLIVPAVAVVGDHHQPHPEDVVDGADSPDLRQLGVANGGEYLEPFQVERVGVGGRVDQPLGRGHRDHGVGIAGADQGLTTAPRIGLPLGTDAHAP